MATDRPPLSLTPLPPEGFRRTPWKNGGGVTLTIAEARLPGTAPGDWDGVLWQFGRTTIDAPGPFSDLAGFERLQTVVAGRGLVLDTEAGEVDLRRPLTIVRYDGGLRIMSRLEDGPVEVVNLMTRRSAAHAELQSLRPGEAAKLPVGRHVIYAFAECADIDIDGSSFKIPAGHAASVEGAVVLLCREGSCLAATVLPI